LWPVAIAAVLYGQATFFIVSQQHAGDRRVAAVAVPAVIQDSPNSVGRSRTAIAKEATKVSTDLARAQARSCVADCPALRVLRIRLAAEIAALKTEGEEATRRDVIEDRYNLQADRIDQLRTTLRADPVAFRVASSLGTTEGFLELLIGLVHAVVLEGTAIVSWMLVAVARGRTTVMSDRSLARSDRAGGRETIAFSREEAAPECEAVAPDRGATVGVSASGMATSENDLLLKKNHEAVAAGQLKPTQEALRKFLRCGQPKAGSLARQYRARFGGIRGQDGHIENIREASLGGAVFRVSPNMAHVLHEGDVSAPGAAAPAMPDP
jgi:hypothetical protein